MSTSPSIELDFHVTRTRKGRKQLERGKKPVEPDVQAVPRIARLMALAIQMDEMIRKREVANYAELARLGHVTRARITQVMDLLNLAPHIQETILLMGDAQRRHIKLTERAIRDLVKRPCWQQQSEQWSRLHSEIRHPLVP